MRAPARLAARLLVPLLAASVALAGCGDSGKQSSPAKEAATPPPPQFWPLTGLQAPAGESVAREHPVMVVKMDNTEASAPQLGLGSADLVVEELVEGGLTRLAAFYYSKIPGTVGPVRSMRASDIGIVSPAKADVVTSGAAAVTIKRIKDAGITFYGEGSKGFARDSSRRAPYNLFANLRKTVALAGGDAETPDNYLAWGTEAEYAGSQPATSIEVPFSYSHTTRWAFQGGKYVNTNSNAKQGDRFQADSVLVLRARVGDAGYKDPAGNPVPETKLEGTGKALLFHNGTVVRGTWSKSALDAPIELRTAAGPLHVPAGHTWIELVPDDGSQIAFK